MNKIDRIMSWYDGLREDLRFLAFLFFVVMPFGVLYLLHPYFGVAYLLFSGISRVMYQMKTENAKVKKNERENA